MRALPSAVARIGDALVTNAGGYLRNTLLVPGVTCDVCATPIDATYSTCFQCNQHRRSGEPIASRVGTIVYAIEHSPSTPSDQTYVAMYGYKAPTPQNTHTQLVRSLAAIGIAGHWTCVGKLSGQRTLRWSTVPGTRHTSTEHPLRTLVAPMFRDPSLELALELRPGATKARALQRGHIEVSERIAPGTHVLVIDDSWVTGGSAQSAAIALREAGAADVSILALARILQPGWAPTAAFLRSGYVRNDFDYSICPWTGGACP